MFPMPVQQGLGAVLDYELAKKSSKYCNFKKKNIPLPSPLPHTVYSAYISVRKKLWGLIFPDLYWVAKA